MTKEEIYKSLADELFDAHEFELWATKENHSKLILAIKSDLSKILNDEILDRRKVQTLFDCL